MVMILLYSAKKYDTEENTEVASTEGSLEEENTDTTGREFLTS